MKLTQESRNLMSFFINNNCLPHIKQTKKTSSILKKLYNEIKNGVSYIQQAKSKMGDLFYKLVIL